MKRGFLWFFKPTWMKMFLFFVFIFALPTYFKICNNSCIWKLEKYSGLVLWSNQAPGRLTFVALFSLMIVAYICSSLVVVFFDVLGAYLKRKIRNWEKKGF